MGRRQAGVFGSNVKRIREAQGISQRRLGDASGVHHVTIAELETGKRQSPDAHTIEALAKALGVRAGELVEPPGSSAALEEALSDFLAGQLPAALSPPLTEEEIEWLHRGVPAGYWEGSPPTPASILLLVQSHRLRRR